MEEIWNRIDDRIKVGGLLLVLTSTAFLPMIWAKEPDRCYLLWDYCENVQGLSKGWVFWPIVREACVKSTEEMVGIKGEWPKNRKPFVYRYVMNDSIANGVALVAEHDAHFGLAAFSIECRIDLRERKVSVRQLDRSKMRW